MSADPGQTQPRPGRPLRTSSFRLTLVYAGILVVLALLLFGVVTLSAGRFMARQIDATVANEMAELRLDAGGDTTALLRPVVERLTQRSPGVFYLLQDVAGVELAGNMEPIRPQPGPRSLARAHPAGSHHVAGGVRGRGLVLPDGGYLFVGLSDFELGEMQEVVARSFVWGLAATLLLALAGGLGMSLAVLRRIEAISATSRDIMRGDLGRRIALRGSGDEFDHLSASLNAMLDRIQALMAGLQQVSSDVAHDLRTPLTRLRQRLELARRRGPDAVDLPTAVDDAITQVDAILATFAALLRIAQVEAGGRRAGFVAVDLSALLLDLFETYGPEAEQRGQSLRADVAPGLIVQGDRELLTQLFTNLLENALTHCPSGSSVRIEADDLGAEGIRASVSDDGPGIPAALHDKVLLRFFRLQESRTTPGNGLGLSLVTAVATLHEGTFSLLDERPGLRCVLGLPRSGPPASFRSSAAAFEGAGGRSCRCT